MQTIFKILSDPTEGQPTTFDCSNHITLSHKLTTVPIKITFDDQNYVKQKNAQHFFSSRFTLCQCIARMANITQCYGTFLLQQFQFTIPHSKRTLNQLSQSCLLSSQTFSKITSMTLLFKNSVAQKGEPLIQATFSFHSTMKKEKCFNL